MSHPKGVSGNPVGRTPDPVPTPGIRFETRQTIKGCIDKLGQMKIEELRALVQDEQNVDVRTLAFARMWISALNKGGSKSLEFLMERSIGKVKEQSDDTPDFVPEKYTPPESIA